uniref:Uncharacterized protein n=1 Tax=Chrysotila carterae TaxID=13221 RepID=A0A7S4BH63_CHRCT
MAPPRNESSEGEPCATRHTCRAKAALLLTPIKPLIQSFCRCLPPEFHAGPGLHSAIVRDDVAALLATIQAKPNPCLASMGLQPDVNELLDGTTGRPLHLAARNASAEVVRTLVQSGLCNCNALDVHGRTALHLAAVRGAPDVMFELLSDPAGLTYVDEPDGEGRSALQLAVHAGNWECAKLLVSRGASVGALTLPFKPSASPAKTSTATAATAATAAASGAVAKMAVAGEEAAEAATEGLEAATAAKMAAEEAATVATKEAASVTARAAVQRARDEQAMVIRAEATSAVAAASALCLAAAAATMAAGAFVAESW